LSLSPQEAVSTPRKDFDKLPEKSGVYILKNSEGTPIYVGKATSIKSRVISHLSAKLNDPLGEVLSEQIRKADYIITQTPIEALILENILIKRHRPRYNIRLKDDKSYPYIKVTTNEIYPKVLVTRRLENDGARYFGPYGNVRAAKRSVKYLRKLFPIRGCNLPLDGVKKFKSCIDYSIGLCKAPCIFAVTKQEYDSDTKKFQLFLEGKLVQLSREMYADMWKASGTEDYEKAAKLRDEIRSLETTALKQRVVLPDQKRDKDVVKIARSGKITAAVVFQVREGNVVGREKFILEGTAQSTDPEILSAFVKQYYGNHPNASKSDEIVLPFALPDRAQVQMLLDSLHSGNGTKVKIVSNSRSPENISLLKLATENASLVLKEEESKDETRKRQRLEGLRELKERFELGKIPQRIECFDISNIHGDEAVGAMTVLIDGFPAKSEYRRFRIKTVKGINDYSMMAEMIGRRFRRLASSTSSKEKPPDLVVIDGGRGHLNAGLEQMHKDGVFGIPTISLAKKEELVFLPKRISPVKFDRSSEGLHILQHVRDEAHRFGITYHRKLRGRDATTSVLDSIEGVGERRKKSLLSYYRSIESIKNSTPEEIAQAAGVSKKLAQVILASLNKSLATGV
jgi:excinuclease ABC subunit C